MHERSAPRANPWRTRHIIVENQAKLTVVNSELIFSATYPWHTEYHALLLYDHVTANITKSKVTYVNGKGDAIYAFNYSKLWIKDVTISTHKPENMYSPYRYPKSGLVTFGRSEVEVQNSTIDEVYALGDCTVDFSNSNVEYFDTTHDSSRVNITDSTISQFEIYGPDSKVWLTNTTIGTLMARSNSKIWLIHCVAEIVNAIDKSGVWLLDSSVKEIVHTNRVWIVWEWPLFGQITVPYDWAQNILPVFALTIALIAIIVLLFLRRRKRRVQVTEETNLSDS